MRFEKLYIRRSYDGSISGSIELHGDAGKIELNLDEPACKKMFEVVASEMVKVSKQAADRLTAEVFSGTPALLES